MRIVTSLFENVEGIYLFPVISLFIFLIIFLVMTIHAFTMQKSYENELSRMPLDNNEPENIKEL